MMSIFKRINVRNTNVGNICIVFYNKIINKLLKAPLIEDSTKTLNRVYATNCSISRFGDGEFKLINNKNLLFQQYNKELSKRLLEILSSNEENHLVCIPYQLRDISWLNDRSQTYWINYLNLNRANIYKILDRRKIYYDAFITRFYIDYRDKKKSKEILNKLKKIWKNRSIVIIEGDQSRLGVGNDLFSNCLSLERIICPTENAYLKYDEILKACSSIEKCKLILIALGPTATVLAYDLHKQGYQALDIGHVDVEYEWYLMDAQEKCPIKYKYVGEAVNGTIVENQEDRKYNSEIIGKILM